MMRLVVQRVTHASVVVENETVGAIGKGLLALVGVEDGDTERDLLYSVDKLCGLRVFEDAQEKMNLSVKDIEGEILLVSQFTLMGDMRHGKRPSFITAARPEVAEPMVARMAKEVAARGIPAQTGRFQTHMEVTLLNDGPVTILIDSRKRL